MENHLINTMPWIVISPAPLLLAAQVNTQAEFDRTFRAIVRSQQYQEKQLLFISCLNIDISPQEGQLFPLTKCVPWVPTSRMVKAVPVPWSSLKSLRC